MLNLLWFNSNYCYFS